MASSIRMACKLQCWTVSNRKEAGLEEARVFGIINQMQIMHIIDRIQVNLKMNRIIKILINFKMILIIIQKIINQAQIIIIIKIIIMIII